MASTQTLTTKSGKVVPRDPLECYVRQEFFLGSFLAKDDASKSKEYIVETMAEEDKPSREEIIKAREERKKAKKENKGQKNKNRPVTRVDLSERLCTFLVDVAPGGDLPKCTFPKCKMQHDLSAFLKQKSADAGPECYVYSTYGYCHRSFLILFLLILILIILLYFSIQFLFNIIF